MVIVAGHIRVAPDQREAYLATCVAVVQQARTAAGCLGFAVSPDLVEPRPSCGGPASSQPRHSSTGIRG